MTRQKLTAEDVEKNLARLDGWHRNGKNLTRRFKFANFIEALKFVNRVGKIAQAADHHPDIKLGWGYAEFFITTHDAGGLTENDFDLAKAIDEIV
ncbi:MAG: 4a-hydroxytetrahydrobiopterin dehydratase [Pyrinomonadaceae bacterium]